MAQYPNYSMNSYIPYQMPMYQQQYQQQQLTNQAYMDRMAQLQAQQMPQGQMQNANQFNPMGKIVESLDIVKATDIPMDGNMYYFPQADGNMIYAKQWMPNGTTRILSFKPVSDGQADNSTMNPEKSKIGLSDDVTAAFMGRFDDIAQRIERLEKSMTYPMTKSSSSRTKKEADLE